MLYLARFALRDGLEPSSILIDEEGTEAAAQRIDLHKAMNPVRKVRF